MKKVLIILFSLILVVGCKKNNNTTDNPKDNEPQEVIHTTMEDVQNRLTEIATEVYNNKNYVGYSKENGKYFISLKELRNTLKYDLKVVDNLDGLVCDENETGIGIDEDNLGHVDYYELPIIVYTLCNPPEIDNSEEQN